MFVSFFFLLVPGAHFKISLVVHIKNGVGYRFNGAGRPITEIIIELLLQYADFTRFVLSVTTIQ